MLKNVIREVSYDFLKEARLSPNLLQDMASMEKYMSESYNGRIFIELLQNADDAGAENIKISNIGKHIIFANDGRKFNKEDILTISRSGASTKKRSQNIGYRGIGFKSTTYITDEIYIYSDSTYFSFSKNTTAKELGMDINKVPLVRIPFLINGINSEVVDCVKKLENEGFETVFVFNNANIDAFMQEIVKIDNGYFLFLNNVKKCSIKIRDYDTTFELSRKKSGKNKIISFMAQDEKSWYVVGSGLTKIAFCYIDGKIEACNDNEAVYHSYLPTTDKITYRFKINGDFSTDPSRKHITKDSRTSEVINDVGKIIFDLVKECLFADSEGRLAKLLVILNNRSSFTSLNNELYDVIRKNVTCTKWLNVANKAINVSNYKILPNWLEESEKQLFRKYSKYTNQISLDNSIYSRVEGLDNFLSQYTSEKYTAEDLINVLSEIELITQLNITSYSKVLANLINVTYSDRFTTRTDYNFSKIIIKTVNGLKTVSDMNSSKIDVQFQSILMESISTSAMEWFADINNIKLNKQKTKTTQKCELTDLIRANKRQIKKHVTKWRSAEQQCIELEENMGNLAIDVSKRNVGYDIESKEQSGKMRYIEVKSLTNIGAAFTITNNEYTAAHQYGEQYYICLMIQDDEELKVIYISNPLAKLEFEKRIRQWEWYCEDYTGELLRVKY